MVKCVGSTSGAYAGSRLLTTSTPNRSVVASQSRHSASSMVPSQGWMNISVLVVDGRARRPDQTLRDAQVGRDRAKAGDEVGSGGEDLLVGDRVEGVEDEQRRGGRVGEL